MVRSRPTVNIEGIVGGYTGPGGKTILPHQATAKLDLRLVPNQTASAALAALKAHLAKRGFGDIDVNMTGGYDPTTTPVDSPIIKVEQAVYKDHGIDPCCYRGWAVRGLVMFSPIRRSVSGPDTLVLVTAVARMRRMNIT